MKFGKVLIMSVGLLEQKDLDQLKHKIQQNGVPANEIDKKSLKADGTFRIYFLKPIQILVVVGDYLVVLLNKYLPCGFQRSFS
jgi:hypothetical protein